MGRSALPNTVAETGAKVPRAGVLNRGRRGDWLRISLIPVFVVACHMFNWNGWRSFNCSVYLFLSHALGIPAVRLSYDTFLTLGQVYHFATACTSLDAYCGSIPLLWEPRRSVARNCSFLAIYLFLLSVVNLLRLAFGMLIFSWGAPWSLSHEAMSGVFYFLLFIWIARRRGWSFTAPSSRTSHTPPLETPS